MINFLMKKYALSKQGAKDLVSATFSCVLNNVALMLPVSLMYLLVKDLLGGAVPREHYWVFVAGIFAALALIYLTARFQYNATYFATYKESSVRRVSLAEKLRKLPLSFFGKKDLSDLTTTLMADSASLETAFSHWIPEFYGAMISTCLIAASLFAFDWRLALAAFWVLPVALAIVAFSKKVQNFFQKKLKDAKVACADGIQECIETVRDLRANNSEEKYLEGLTKKIAAVEKRAVKSELGTAMFVVTAGMLLKLGIATVALAGGFLLKAGGTDVLTFFMYLLLVSRLYDPLNGALQNLAAVISLQINIDRMKEIENYPVLGGENVFSSDGYDIVFENVGFAYNSGETVLKDISFTARQGEVTALIGPSGGGKSTIAKLAARFWDADKGKITIGGTDIKTVDPESLCRRIR